MWLEWGTPRQLPFPLSPIFVPRLRRFTLLGEGAWAFVIDIDIFIIASFANIDIFIIASIAAQAYCLREDEEP